MFPSLATGKKFKFFHKPGLELVTVAIQQPNAPCPLPFDNGPSVSSLIIPEPVSLSIPEPVPYEDSPLEIVMEDVKVDSNAIHSILDFIADTSAPLNCMKSQASKVHPLAKFVLVRKKSMLMCILAPKQASTKRRKYVGDTGPSARVVGTKRRW